MNRKVQKPHLLPDVVMREETTQFTLGERSTVIWVFVPGQHINPLNVTLVQSPDEQRRDKQGD